MIATVRSAWVLPIEKHGGSWFQRAQLLLNDQHHQLSGRKDGLPPLDHELYLLRSCAEASHSSEPESWDSRPQESQPSRHRMSSLTL